MFKIDHEICGWWGVGDYLDWVVMNYASEFNVALKDFANGTDEEKNLVLFVEPNFGDGSIYWALDNHRLRELPEVNSRWKGAKLLFYTQPSLKYFFKGINQHAFCVPFAAEPELHRPYDFPKDYDVGIVMQADGERGKFVEEVMEKSGLKWLNVSDIKSPWEYSWKLSRCKLLFNAARKGEVNMRFFEGMSIGTLVTDRVPDSKYFAEENVHYAGYRSWDVNGAVDVLKDLLTDDERRERLAKNSRELIKKRHTYKHRLLEIINIVKEVSK